MLNVKSAANRIFQEFQTDMLKEFDAAPRLWRNYAMEIPSSSRSTLHAWIANQAVVREWLGPRIARSMGSRTWEVVNHKWELTYEFDRDQIDDDLSGLLAQAVFQARNMGEKFARHEDLLVATALEDGLTKTCFDGQYFFDTDHPVDVDAVTSGTFSNSLTSTALTHANFNTALVTLRGYKNVDGSPLVNPGSNLLLMVPPALTLKAKQIVAVQSLTPAASIGLFGTSGASDNPLFGAATVVENPYLTSTTRWFLLASAGLLKPLMLQRRRPLETSETGAGSEAYFEEEKIKIGGSARYTASYTLPQLAICCDA